MTRVVKIGGRPQSDPGLADAIAAGWRDELDGLVLVHGGGDEVTTLQSALGEPSSFVDGRRVTSARDIDLVRMVLSGSANKRLVALLVGNGIEAVGLSGEDAALIGASPVDADRLGYVGTPSTVNVAFLRHLLSGGYLPVVSPVSRDATSDRNGALNVNGDDAAAAIAVAMGAAELLLVADVPGVLCDGKVIPKLTPDDARELIARGTAIGGMRAKLEAGLCAIEGGVGCVRISDLAAIADRGRGTILRRIGDLT